MILERGKSMMLSVLAGQESAFGSAVSLGVGTTAPTLTDTSLVAESLRVPLVLRSPDFISGEVIYKATVPAEIAGKFYEIGVNSVATPVATDALFGDFDEEWTNGVLDATHARVGANAVRIDANASGNKTATINKDLTIDVSGIIGLNYFVGSNVSSAYVRLRTDSSNYYHYALPVTAGYRNVSIPLTSFTPTGAPSPDNITSVVIYLASTAGGASQLHFDSLTIKNPPIGGDLLVRQVLAQPIVKQAGVELDVEIPITITL